ncbi:type II toxin-antitoxin system VapC family toxin [Rhodomicrobium sp. Az07]|uniref:PIN domain-containing protein n=1 Tax=Rhodomicrobium sp. Az07 TaxID=2839034 RepID=UPI001BE9BA76|nr:type II toxin-antitoxin system VapC family toxin [Rhodomicrobium sp. Az07]MBT3069888.1 type II toxin-antitoxin system VapC family toxin [Rhodomicrobium sp. Az07]
MCAAIVLDASAILAHLGGEPGAERAEAFFGNAAMSSVNLSEVVAKLQERGAGMPLVRAALSRYGLDIVPFDEDLAFRAGALRVATKAFGLSLGDRACLALAEKLRLPVLTADRTWRDIALSVEVHVLR